MSLIDTNGLPYQITFVVNIYYMITTNTDVSDGLANGAVGKLVHAETDNNGVITIAWLEFPELPRIGEVTAVAEWYRYRIVACLVTSSIPVPLKTRRVGQRCTLNLSRAETSSRWCGVVVRRGGASSGVVHVT
ncbi:uncharacterized protein TNCV_4280701 [Trichonephila clavipes]|nr:uncharacterized protein TNCV_4280701 [Trichonephila clavipes]